MEENGVQFPLKNLADLDAFKLKIIKNKPLRRAVILKMGHFKPDRPDCTRYIKCDLSCIIADSLSFQRNWGRLAGKTSLRKYKLFTGFIFRKSIIKKYF
jgi:hypothetical protein